MSGVNKKGVPLLLICLSAKWSSTKAFNNERQIMKGLYRGFWLDLNSVLYCLVNHSLVVKNSTTSFIEAVKNWLWQQPRLNTETFLVGKAYITERM